MNAPADTRADQALDQGFQLGELKVVPHAGELAGPGGAVKLDPKVMDVLVMLAQHAGQVVLREELLARLWPHAVATDDVLSRCIYELRRHLSQAGGDERFKSLVDTVPKRGYRLNGEVVAFQPATDVRPPGRSRRLLLALAFAAVLGLLLWFTVGRQSDGPDSVPRSPPAPPAASSIAVLPFADMSEGQDQGYFSDGIAEEILNRLAQTKGLRVISRTSSFSFRDQPVNIPAIAAALDVTHVLEGSVRRSGDKIRITAQLIAASSNAHEWSETYERSVGDLFAIQDEIAGSVATALQATLGVEESRNRRPPSFAAHERFLQGHFFYSRRAPGDIERSAKYFEEAVSIDPGYARAWAALSGAANLLAARGDRSSKEWRKRQGDTALKAVSLDPNLAVAHARLGRYFFQMGDPKRGEAHFQKAFALNPDDPLVLGTVASRYLRRGDPEGAIAAQSRVVSQDPLSAAQRRNLATYLFVGGHLDEAVSEFRKMLELAPEEKWQIESDIVRIRVAQGRYVDAQSALAEFPDGPSRDRGLAMLYRAPGQREEADRAVKRLAGLPAEEEGVVRLAEIYAIRGQIDEAFASLHARRARLERNGVVSIYRIWDLQEEMRFAYFLKPLQADPRWAALMEAPKS